MGCFLSKKDSGFAVSAKELDPKELDSELGVEVELKKTIIVPEKQHPEKAEESLVKKEVFVIKHRKSYDRDRPEKVIADGVDSSGASVGLGVRTSSCSREEVEAILIQCGRLSRNSSGRSASNSASRSRKCSGSKKSSDFDHCDNGVELAAVDVDDDGDEMVAEKRRHRQCHRQSRGSSHGRTPSRERDQQQQQQRSNSRERSSGRRVSRSPGRRSETSSLDTGRNAANNKPAKMISVPATVSSLVMDKSNNGGGSGSDAAIKRVSAKRNAGESVVVGSRGACSPRSQSPARINANVKSSGENQQPSLSRSSSRKAEHSPYRRMPLGEVDTNSLAYRQAPSNKVAKNRSKEIEGGLVVKEPSIVMNQKPNAEINNRVVVQKVVEETNGQPRKTSNITVTTVVDSGAESLKPPVTLTRSRSSRQSQDLDLNPEILLNPINSYNSQLLEDIQSFHQKNTTSVAVPACLTKACSILEAVADLNSNTRSNPSSAFSSSANLGGKKQSETKDPFVDSEVTVSDDLMEPSLQKYVTVRRAGMLGEEDMLEEESSGSNSVACSGLQHRGFSSSSWEPSSADSTECWTSRSNTREYDLNPVNQRLTLSESGQEMERARKGFTGKTRDFNYQRTRIISASKDARPIPIAAAAAST